MTGASPPDLVEVRLVGFPLVVYQLAREHTEELRREFALLALRPVGEGGHELPGRLLTIVEQLSAEYAGVTSVPDRLRDEALERGKSRLDLAYTVPRSAAHAARVLGALLDEADRFCRDGEHLLTLAAPPEAVRFRRWYLGEFVDQIETGRPPTSWPDFCD